MSGLAGRGGKGRQNVDTVQALFGHLAGDDPRELVDSLDPEVDVLSGKGLPGAGGFHGVPGYLRWYERWSAAWELESLWVAMIEPVGPNHVIAMVRQRAKAAAAGEPVPAAADEPDEAAAGEPEEATVTYMWELRSGHVVRLHAYPDRRAAIDAARGRGGDERQAD